MQIELFVFTQYYRNRCHVTILPVCLVDAFEWHKWFVKLAGHREKKLPILRIAKIR